MNAKTRQPSAQASNSLHISPALETTPTPLSTHWIPLHELIGHWTTLGAMLDPAPVAPILTALGHAFLALADETQALRLFSLAWAFHETSLRAATTRRCAQVEREIGEAARHWGLAAGHLESLSPTDLEQEAAERVRRLAQVARSQQARLWALMGEVRADTQTWRQRTLRAHAHEHQEVG